MTGHDIIVLGASAGGVAAFMQIVGALPANLPAAVFVVQHIPATEVSLLPGLLSKASSLPVHQPATGATIAHGQIYVAPPDHHLLLDHGHIHVLRGPKENGFRPAIDATLRTAARAYGPRVIGAVLTGMLDDGTAGLLAVKRRGGIAVVQDPDDAAYPPMPQSALRYVQTDVVCRLAELPALLVQLAHTPAYAEEHTGMPDRLDLEADASGMQQRTSDPSGLPGDLTPFSCPDCGGVLMEYYDGDLLRFRCQVGHVLSRESMVESQTAMLDQATWSTYRALNERATLARRLVRDAETLGDQAGARRFAQLVVQAEQQKEQLREIMLGESAPD